MTDAHRLAERVVPEAVVVGGRRYVLDGNEANRVSIHGMYDCHLFTSYKGATVRDIAVSWRAEHDTPDDQYGPVTLCPAIVLRDGKELRRVGSMVHCLYKFSDKDAPAKQQAQLERWIAACEADPDIPRLLATGAQ